jgi:dihydrolipoamide dehydrogenase
METAGNSVNVTVESKDGTKSILETDMILLSVGRKHNSDNLGLENAGIETIKGAIPVGDYYQTKVPNIYAIGDVTDVPQFAHVASKTGEIAVEHIAGKNPPKGINLLAIPSAVYTDPQIGSFGYKEAELKEKEIKHSKATFPYKGIGKAVAVEKSEGFIKVLYKPDTKEILGFHAVGADASEIMHEALLAKTAELLPQDVASMIHAHPTISEGVMEVMRAVEGWAIHA